MAKIIKNSNHLREEITMAYAKLVIASISIIVSFIAMIPSHYITIVVIGLMTVWIMLILNRIEILKFGLNGEKVVLDLLDKLPKGYSVLSDVHIVDANKSSQIDFVIVGNNGIFIMESKHIRGIINGKEESMYLEKIKTSKSGDKYKSRIFNPIKQISGHKKGIEIFLKKRGFNIRVYPILYFSNNCIVNIKSKKVKIITEQEKVIEYIKKHNKNSKFFLNRKTQEKVVNELVNIKNKK